MEAKYDFFISYNKADTHWAEWIAWQLEEAGYKTRIQVWDFGAGSNFALEMHQASIESAHTIAVLSPTFLKSEFCAPEWAAAFVQDPTGRSRKLLPVRVRECTPSGLLTALDYIDLVAKEEAAAKDELLNRIEKALQIVKGERAKPDSPIVFPGREIAAEFSKPGFPGTLPPIWRVPYNRNPNFTGREAELTFLREQLISGSPTALTQAISGLGGVGKTQLALEYIYRHAGDYDLVWWIRSEEPATLAADIADLATPLELPQAEMAEQVSKVQAVRQKLGQFTGWLLVFDNAGRSEDISPYLPQGSGGHIIITSRNDVWQRLAQKVSMKPFDRAESIKFLVKRTEKEDEAGANILADELGDLPLALEQAGAYIEETGRSLSDYVELFRTRRIDLLKSQTAPVNYPDTALTAWDLSMQQVSEESSEAVSLLNLFSFLSPDDIPCMLLAQKNDHLPSPISRAISDPLIKDKAIASLKRYSLVHLSGDGFSVHRLVQAVVRKHLPADKLKCYCNAAVELVSAAMPSDTTDHRSWPICGRIAPHALAVWAHSEDLKVADKATAGLLNKLGLYFFCIAEYQNAKPVLEQTLEICRKVLGEEHPDTTSSLNNLGSLLQAMGDNAAARPYYERTLEIRRKVLGEEHPDTATSLNNLGFLLQAMGDNAAARPYYEQALEICRKVLGEEHLDTTSSLNNLGGLLQAMGDNAAARPYYKQALEIHRKVLGEEHPDTATSLNNLGFLLQAMGDNTAARPYYEQALETRRKVLGEEHPDTAASLNNLGFLLQAIGDNAAARPYYEQALEIRRKVLGEEHPETARSLNNLAVLLQAMGDNAAARAHYKQALEIRRKVLGEEHPETARSLNNLGVLLQAMGDNAAARPYFEQSLEIRRKVLGEEHPDTALSLNNLAILCYYVGDLKEAVEFMNHVVMIFNKILGPQHPHTESARKNLAVIKQQMRQE
jgi:tetratricopeptide (TPR) repeat protein